VGGVGAGGGRSRSKGSRSRCSSVARVGACFFSSRGGEGFRCKSSPFSRPNFPSGPEKPPPRASGRPIRFRDRRKQVATLEGACYNKVGGSALGDSLAAPPQSVSGGDLAGGCFLSGAREAYERTGVRQMFRGQTCTERDFALGAGPRDDAIKGARGPVRRRFFARTGWDGHVRVPSGRSPKRNFRTKPSHAGSPSRRER